MLGCVTIGCNDCQGDQCVWFNTDENACVTISNYERERERERERDKIGNITSK